MKVRLLNKTITKKNARRFKRKLRIRGKIKGIASYPRMNFFRSNKNILVQVIDDKIGNTLASVSTYEETYKMDRPTVDTAKKLGEVLASRLKEKEIKQVVFDRNGYRYHGVLAAFVDSAREAGIKI